MGSIVNILWTVAVVLIALWVLSFVLGWVATGTGWLFHLLLVAAVVVIAYNMMTNKRSV